MSLLISLIAFLEGFTTLSIEIIALRRFTPIIGSNSVSTSIILGVILLALSYGYYRGGKNSEKYRGQITQKVIMNLAIASMYYLLFTFLFDTLLLDTLLDTTKSYFLSILIVSILLFFIPVFLASQTIPLLSEILPGENTGEKVGRLLFFSTVGSFLGSVMTSSVLFPLFGVANTATLNSLILAGITILITTAQKRVTLFGLFGIATFTFGIFTLFRPETQAEGMLYHTSNSYHDITIYDRGNMRIFSQNGAYSSGIDRTTKESFFRYIIELRRILLEKKYKKILVIGAAGFTLPRELALDPAVERVDVVDVDESLPLIAETYFLSERLSPKIHFFPESARYFLRNAKEQYDAIVVDVYVGKSLPGEAVTLEFFQSLRAHSEHIFINMITDTELDSLFSERLLATLHRAFGAVYFLNTSPGNTKNGLTNFILTNVPIPGYSGASISPEVRIYTDDRQSVELDIFERDSEKMK